MQDQTNESGRQIGVALAEKGNLDEAFLACTEGHSLFDSNGYLVSWSPSLALLYPTLADDLRVGMHYSNYLHGLVTKSAIRNIGQINNLDDWIASEIEKVGKSETEFVHHLLDGRSILIRHTPYNGITARQIGCGGKRAEVSRFRAPVI